MVKMDAVSMKHSASVAEPGAAAYAPEGMADRVAPCGATPRGTEQAETLLRRYGRLAEAGIELAALREPQALIESACAHAQHIFEAHYALIAASAPGTPEGVATHFYNCGTRSNLELAPPPIGTGWLGSIHADRITRRLAPPDGAAEHLGLPPGYPPAHAALAAPLVSETACHGWLCVMAREGTFDADDERLITSLAAQAGRLYEAALLHQRHDEQARERDQSSQAMLAVLQRLEALRSLDAEILAARSPRGVVRVGLEHLAHLVSYWGASVTMMDNSGTGAVVLAARPGDPGSAYNPGQYLTEQQYGEQDLDILRRGEIREVPDIEAMDKRPPVIDSLYRQGMRSYARIPMLVEGNLIGTLNLGSNHKHHFAREQLEFARSLANQLGIAAQQATLRERIARQAAELEQRVIERTTQLASANEDLEAFSYTVSHDLRAPLRAVDGFSRMFAEDYAAQIDDHGRHLLDTIRTNCARMGLLIDDLLRFAQLGRARVSARPVDMDELARQAWQETAGHESAELRLASLPAAQGDFSLIKQVWVNLLSNAHKYSSKCAAPVIEVSGRETDTEVVYCVADNGAGFDMRFYEKLFGVFQRLHSHTEFPGTGVGLAMVQRVVARHGGKVWAESVEGQGAQFYFSLPRASEPPI